MKKLILFFILISQSTHADEFNLDFGLRLGQRQSYSDELDSTWNNSLGFVASTYYWLEHWAFGVQVAGSYTDDAQTNLTTNSGRNITGEFNYRHITYGPVVRYYFSNVSSKRPTSYLLVGAAKSSAEVHRPNLGIATHDDDELVRFFLKGYAFLFSYGYEFADSPYFIRFDYTLERFNDAEIILTDDAENSTLANEGLNHSLDINTFYITLGIARIF